MFIQDAANFDGVQQMGVGGPQQLSSGSDHGHLQIAFIEDHRDAAGAQDGRGGAAEAVEPIGDGGLIRRRLGQEGAQGRGELV